MIKHLSHSSLTLWKNCPRSWWANYVLGKKQAPTEAASWGSQFDQALAHRLGLGDPPPNKLEGIDSAVNFYTCQPGAWSSADEAQKEIRIEPNQWEFLAEQLGFSSRIFLPIIGYLDLFKQTPAGPEVLDMKTSSRTQFRSDWALQVFGLYTLATQAVQAHVHLLVRLKNGMNFAPYSFRPTKQTWIWTISQVAFYAAQIEQALSNNHGDELARNPDYYCDWCPEKFECTAQAMLGIR